jgi:SANT/Myb-like domain of DAMP1
MQSILSQNIMLKVTFIRTLKMNTRGYSKVGAVSVGCLCAFSLVYLPAPDKEWMKEETDHLFELARDYDCRFYIVADRYDYAGGPERSMEVCSLIEPFPLTSNRRGVGFERSVL